MRLRPRAITVPSSSAWLRREAQAHATPTPGAPLSGLRSAVPLRGIGVYDIVRQRAEQAGIPRMYPHLFRDVDYFVYAWPASGVSEGGFASWALGTSMSCATIAPQWLPSEHFQSVEAFAGGSAQVARQKERDHLLKVHRIQARWRRVLCHTGGTPGHRRVLHHLGALTAA